MQTAGKASCWDFPVPALTKPKNCCIIHLYPVMGIAAAVRETKQRSKAADADGTVIEMENTTVDFSRQLSRLIVHLNRMRKRFMNERLRSCGLGGALYMFLTALDHNPGASQDYLVGHFYMDKGNVARGAKKLEDLGYIRRETDPEDRRQYRLYLTDKGRELLPTIRSYIEEWSGYLTEGMSPEEGEAAIRLLTRMAENGTRHF